MKGCGKNRSVHILRGCILIFMEGDWKSVELFRAQSNSGTLNNERTTLTTSFDFVFGSYSIPLKTSELKMEPKCFSETRTSPYNSTTFQYRRTKSKITRLMKKEDFSVYCSAS
jgi:hypothetical protein